MGNAAPKTDALDRWAALGAAECVTWHVPYGLERFQESVAEASHLAFKWLPVRFWQELQRLPPLCEPALASVASGTRLPRKSVGQLAQALASAVRLHEESSAEIQAKQQDDQLAPDIAWRLAQAFGNVEARGRFLFASAYPCAEAVQPTRPRMEALHPSAEAVAGSHGRGHRHRHRHRHQNGHKKGSATRLPTKVLHLHGAAAAAAGAAAAAPPPGGSQGAQHKEPPLQSKQDNFDAAARNASAAGNDLSARGQLPQRLEHFL